MVYIVFRYFKLKQFGLLAKCKFSSHDLNMDHELEDIALQNVTRDVLKDNAANQILMQRILDLGRVEAALDRLVAGTFGLCTMCDQKIALERLLVDPAIGHCEKCDAPSNQAIRARA